MSGIHEAGSYAQGGQNVHPYAPSTSQKDIVDKYKDKIIDNFQKLGAKAELGKPLLPVGQSILYDRLSEEKIKKELQTVREDFLKEATSLLQQRKSELDMDYELKVTEVQVGYNNKLKEKDAELDRARRIIDIQAAILYEVNVENPGAVTEVCRKKDLTEVDLELLASGGKSIS